MEEHGSCLSLKHPGRGFSLEPPQYITFGAHMILAMCDFGDKNPGIPTFTTDLPNLELFYVPRLWYFVRLALKKK